MFALDVMLMKLLASLCLLTTIRSSAELNSFGRPQGIAVSLESNDPKYNFSLVRSDAGEPLCTVDSDACSRTVARSRVKLHARRWTHR